MDNRCAAVFRELRSAVSVEQGEKWKRFQQGNVHH
jgi:hypothetical protein